VTLREILMAIQWGEQRVAVLTATQLQTGAIEIATRCDAELAKRPMKAAPRQRKAANNGRYVTGFHFVCDAERGVTINPDGTFWTGVWVGDEVHAASAW
jgi:hypothetical protein